MDYFDIVSLREINQKNLPKSKISYDYGFACGLSTVKKFKSPLSLTPAEPVNKIASDFFKS